MNCLGFLFFRHSFAFSRLLQTYVRSFSKNFVKFEKNIVKTIHSKDSKYKTYLLKKTINGGMLTIPQRKSPEKPRRKKFTVLLPEFDAIKGDQLEIQSDGGKL